MVFLSKPFVANFKSANHVRFLQELKTLGSEEPQILKTGFVLEHRVSQLLRNAGWTVISGKYYIDDNEDTVREIDLVAYKVAPVQHFVVYTALIISCKKSESNAWVLLTRDLDRRDPNRIWQPLHVWSNDKALAYEIGRPMFSAEYHEAALKRGGLSVLAEPAMDVFAFQEMNRQTGVPQNDKAIFSSITSLMKAQSYEVNALPSRKKDVCLYQFSLLSVVDADLIRLAFGQAAPQAHEIKESENYIASYIIKRKQEFARIRFIRASAFEKTVQDYDRLHNFNCGVFSEFCDRFYKDIFTDSNRTKVLIDDFRKLVSWPLEWRLWRQFSTHFTIDGVDVVWKADPDRASIQTSLTKGHLENAHLDFLNEDTEAKAAVAEALAKIYRYKGTFVFEECDVPF